MYEMYFGLKEKPFTLTPDPAFLYMSRQHRRAVTALDYALLHGAGFALVTGEIGSGKTTLIRHLLGRKSADTTIGLISNAHPGLGPVLPWVAQALGLAIAPGTSSAVVHEQILQFALKEYTVGRRVVIVVDEAQHLGASGLEELRLLSNLNADKDLVLQTFLFGQPELRDLLRRDELRQFAQRIGIEYHLGTLPREEIPAYVRHRLAVAGARTEVISREAIDLLHGPTAGVPRLINMLCDLSLVYCFGDRRLRVDGPTMRQVIQDRMAGGVLPLRTAPPLLASAAPAQ
jgi:type II secretory pathway predicted ATPase ExeA